MAMLRFSHRNRSLLWYQRAAARRHQQLRQFQQPHTSIKRVSLPRKLVVLPTTSSAVVALARQTTATQTLVNTSGIRSASPAPDSSSSMGAFAAVATASVASASEDNANATTPQLVHSSDTLMTTTTATDVTARDISLEQTSDQPDEPQSQETSWTAMLVALFAMIQPEWTKDKLNFEDVPLEEIPIQSVPPQISEVLPSRDTALFWRYDMDSYAANRRNEDRSQYVLEAIVRPGRSIGTSVFFCGCYDGHGGEEAVDFVQKKLYTNIRAHLTENDETVVHSIISGFKDTEEEFKRRSQIKFQRGSWSSCSKNFYVKGRLQPTRSIGDTYMKVKDVNRSPMPRGLRIRGSFRRPYVSAVPDVFQVDLTDRKPEFVVLGSDGLFGELKNEEIVQLVGQFRDQGVQNVSQALREAVLERIAAIYGTTAKDLENVLPGNRRDYHDDITIDVLHFTPPRAAAEAEAA
ncbi:Protein phosphatase 2C [Phytophthora megakarya]|uniref:protein-serine/threonine phosphatase n=1 Tax=Phytophthora megakarya TaxID=4795 RepID=A0A225WM38_9STRA|nr:Protein phosphatase 2C [Phytophthora megakarya]